MITLPIEDIEVQGCPDDLLILYDKLKDGQRFFRADEIRAWLSWHWTKGLLLVARINGKPVGVAMLYRLKDIKDLMEEDIRLRCNPEGEIAYCVYCYCDPRYRSTGSVLRMLLHSFHRLHPWAKWLAWQHMPLQKRLDKYPWTAEYLKWRVRKLG